MPPKARRDMLLIEEVEDEIVVYDQERQSAQRLNPSTAMVFRHLDGEKTVEDLTEILKQDLTDASDEDLVWTAASELAKAQRLEAPTGRSADDTRISKRHVVRRLGLVGRLSLLIPMVSSIVAPEAAEASSPPTGGDDGADGGGGS